MFCFVNKIFAKKLHLSRDQPLAIIHQLKPNFRQSQTSGYSICSALHTTSIHYDKNKMDKNNKFSSLQNQNESAFFCRIQLSKQTNVRKINSLQGWVVIHKNEQNSSQNCTAGASFILMFQAQDAVPESMASYKFQYTSIFFIKQFQKTVMVPLLTSISSPLYSYFTILEN